MKHKTIGRISLYRRLLRELSAEGQTHVYSHELASMAGGTAAQVRRDLMDIKFTGSPSKGYDIQLLVECIGKQLDTPSRQRVALVGIGNLGRALLTYFTDRNPKLSISAAFDTDPSKIGRVISGCHCHGLDDLADVIARERILTGILAVPAGAAQEIATRLYNAGIRGIVNFAPIRLSLPPGVYVENLDMTTALEKVAFFARQQESNAESS